MITLRQCTTDFFKSYVFSNSTTGNHFWAIHFDYHPRFAGKEVPRVYDRSESTRIEGGDELILSKEVVGISQRTDAASIENCEKYFEQKLGFKNILAFDIGEHRKFMHLDTVLP